MDSFRKGLFSLCIFLLMPMADGMAQNEDVLNDTLRAAANLSDSISTDSAKVEQTFAAPVAVSATTSLTDSLPPVDSLAQDTLVYYLIPESELPDSLIYAIAMYEELWRDSNFVLAYYPWKMVFDSHAVHRVDVYDKGISILNGLVENTEDSIQQEIYLDELMNLYDVWYELTDIINARNDSPYSRTLIKSEKARRYNQLLPEVYKISVGGDSVYVKANGDTIAIDQINRETVMRPEIVRAYEIMRDALYEQENKVDLHYEIPYVYFMMSNSRLAHDHKGHAEQYQIDFDSVDLREAFMLEQDLNQGVIGNIQIHYDQITDVFEENSTSLMASTGDCDAMEIAFNKQLADKLDLWDFGVEPIDDKLLKRIIRNMARCKDSESYLTALEYYMRLPVTEETFADVMAKRKMLADEYMRRERFDEALQSYRQLAADEQDPLKKSELYYRVGLIYATVKNSNNNALGQFKRAFAANSEYGDACYRLAECYASVKMSKDPVIDRIKYLLVIDKMEQAIAIIERNKANPAMRKFNTTSVENIRKRIGQLIPVCPDQSELVMYDKKYSTPGSKIQFDGNTITIRFY